MPELPRLGQPKTQNNMIYTTVDKVLRASDGPATVIVDSASSRIVTLPAARKGLMFTIFAKQAPGSGVGVLVKVAGTTAKIFSKVSATGAAISEAAGKGVVNTQGTAVKGDFVTVECDGVDWIVTAIGGTWAREA